ncbi:MAG: hypothetical protein NUW12_09930 [Firmicutes bacterium]|nr:hypothetical protein [Bacillota bacterium]MDH7496354.1 HEAT repeat domain-containing protein [Bacillota bacterium]
MDTHASPGKFVMPTSEELAARSDEDIESTLARAAREMKAAAVPGLERLAAAGDPRVILAAVRALGEVRDACAAEALARIKDGAGDKSVRKEAGRSLQRLKSAGINPAPVPQGAARHAPAISMPAGKVESAFAGYYDREGTRLLATQVWSPARGRTLIVWALNEESGVEDCRVFHGSKRALREWARDHMKDMRLVEIDVEHARFLMKEAADAGRRAGKEMPRGYAVYSEAVRNMPAPPTRPIVYERLEVDGIRNDASALRASRRLLGLSFACPWDLGEAARPFRERIIGIAKSVIYTSPAVRSERVRATVDEAAAAMFTPEVAERYRRRLEETAYLLLLEGRVRPARSALAAALAIADGKPLSEMPFVQALVEKSIGVARRGAREEARLRRLRAERERHRLVRPAFEPESAEDDDEALFGGEEGAWEIGPGPEWEGSSREEDDDHWRDDTAAESGELGDRGDGQSDGGRSIIIDPRNPRPLR